MMDHEPSISSTTPIRGRDVGTTAIDSCPKHSGWTLQTLSTNLGTGRRVQHHGCESNCQSSLYKRPQMGQTLSIPGFGGTARPQTIRSSESPRRRSGGSGYQDSHFPSSELERGIYHMISGQVGKTSGSTLRDFLYQPRDHTPYTFSPWSSMSDWPNLVRKQRSKIRGKKNAIIQGYRHRPDEGRLYALTKWARSKQSLGEGKHGASGPSFVRIVINGTLLWFCAFNPNTGRAVGKGFPTKSAECCRAFWLEYTIPSWPRGSIHLVMDNLSSHKKAFRELPARIRRRIHVYWTPTNSS